nr:MAG TPA: hypothetical protein [Caudoviricetes sp.]
MLIPNFEQSFDYKTSVPEAVFEKVWDKEAQWILIKIC